MTRRKSTPTNKENPMTTDTQYEELSAAEIKALAEMEAIVTAAPEQTEQSEAEILAQIEAEIAAETSAKAAADAWLESEPESDIVDDAILEILTEISFEAASQDAKWGEQNHPNGTGADYWGAARDAAKEATDQAAQQGGVTWQQIAVEEVYEAFAENDPALLRAELVQAAAVLAQWIGAIDRAKASNGS